MPAPIAPVVSTRSVPTVALALIPLLLAVAPLLAPAAWYPHDFQRALQVLGLLVAVVCWSSAILRDSSRTSPLVSRLLALWVILAGVSTALALNKLAALREVALLAGCVILADTIRRCDIHPNATWIARGTAVGAGLYACTVLLTYLGALAGGTLYLDHIILGFDNYRFLNHSQTVMLPLTAVAAATGPDRRWRRFALAVLVAQIALLLLTRGRATMLALVLATAMAVLVVPSTSSRQIARMITLCAIGGGLLNAVLFRALPYLLGFSWATKADPIASTASGYERLVLWSNALQTVRDSPWIGAGPMHFARLHLPMGAHPHNVYLQWLAEYGVIAGSLMCISLVVLIWVSAKRLRTQSNPSTAAVGAWMACAAVMVDGFLSGNFVMPMSQCWIALAFGVMCKLALPATIRIASMHRTYWLAASGGTTVVVLAILTFSDLQKAPPHVGETLHSSDPGMVTNPRFWLNGRL